MIRGTTMKDLNRIEITGFDVGNAKEQRILSYSMPYAIFELEPLLDWADRYGPTVSTATIDGVFYLTFGTPVEPEQNLARVAEAARVVKECL